MPTESSVVSSLIRDLNTHRLPSEPGDNFLFQPVPGRSAPPKVADVPRPAVVANTRAPAKALSPVKVAQAPRAKSTGKWWQLAAATLVIGGWAYVATQLDSQDATVASAAITAPAVAPAVVPAAAPTPAVVTAIEPAAAAQPAPTVTPIATAPAATPSADPQPGVETVATETPSSVAETPVAKKHHRKSKAKRVATKSVKAEPAAKADVPAQKPAKTSKAPTGGIADPFGESAKTAKSEPAAKPEPVAPPPKPAAPAKPPRQSMDNEDPLK
jgi:DNA segregation ATPase FtsK/SpoIIIE, S-DNA-T family